MHILRCTLSLQMKTSYLAGQFHLSVMPRFIQIMMGLQSGGALPIIKKVQLTVVRLAWIMLNVPSQVKGNATYGFIVHMRLGAILQISMNINIRSAG